MPMVNNDDCIEQGKLLFYPFRISEILNSIGENAEELNVDLGRGRRSKKLLNSRLSRIALALVLSRHLGRAVRSDDICRSSFGKPMLKSDAFQFNISHTDEWAYVVVSRAKVGVDIEKSMPMLSPTVGEYFRSLYAASERDATEHPHGNNSTVEAYECWSQAEAVVKCLGVGMSESLESLSLRRLFAQQAIELKTPMGCLWLRSLPHPGESCAYVACAEPISSILTVASESTATSLNLAAETSKDKWKREDLLSAVKWSTFN